MKILTAIGLVLLVAGSVADAADQSGDKAQPEKEVRSVYQAAVPEQWGKRDESVKVWTNADLEKLGTDAWATTSTRAGSGPSGRPSDSGAEAMEWLQERVERKQSRNERIAIAQADLDAAEARLANLKKQLLATVNPFSARPKLSEEEDELRRTGSEDAEQRNERTKKLTDEARAEVQAARTRLQQARAGR